MHWLGIDVGTGGTRALLVDETGRVAGSFTAGHDDMRMDRPLRAEQDPQNWWDATVAAVRGALATSKVGEWDVRGVGLTGQMHGLVLLDDAGTVIRPSIIWCDQRSQKQVDTINQALGPENVTAWTANPPITGFTLPKLLWVRDNEPDRYGRIRKVLLPKDYVRFRLTGVYASDVSDASGTGLFDVVHRRWSDRMLEGLAIDRSILPEVVESGTVAGGVSREGAASTGLPEGTPVVGGAGDQAASAIGNGIVETGVASCTLGTSGVVFAHMGSPAYDPAGRVHTFCHAVPGAWHVMGVTQGAGLSLQWFRTTFDPDASYGDLTREAAGAAPGSDGLFWLPYLMGERTPHLDAAARASWVGITARHTRAEMIRSLIEGVCYSQKDCLDIIEGMGVEVRRVRASGGGSRSPFWRQVLADVLGKPVIVSASAEGSAYGGALLAMAGTGGHGSVSEISRQYAGTAERHEPDAETHAMYRSGHEVYRSLYSALRPLGRERVTPSGGISSDRPGLHGGPG